MGVLTLLSLINTFFSTQQTDKHATLTADCQSSSCGSMCLQQLYICTVSQSVIVHRLTFGFAWSYLHVSPPRFLQLCCCSGSQTPDLSAARQRPPHTETSLETCREVSSVRLCFTVYEFNSRTEQNSFSQLCVRCPKLWLRLTSIYAIDAVSISHAAGRLHGDGHLLQASHGSLKPLH